MNPERNRSAARPALLRRTAMAATLVLAGCSALQIDVDVYKGPLVNHEEIQREQLIAMAMSAKTLMYSMRNAVLDDACKHWSDGPARKRRVTVLVPDEWEAMITGLTEKPAASEACTPDELAHNDEGLRRARRLDELLVYYDDRPTEGTAAAARSTNGLQRIFKTPEGKGIDALADDYFAARHEALNGSSADSAARRQKAGAAFGMLVHTMTDLAGRMQFLATNLWLVDDGAVNARHNKDKTLIESIANNIIVHADDLRRREEFDVGQLRAGGAEALAADAGFALDAAGQLRNIEVALADDRAAALAAEAAAAADTADGPVGQARTALDVATKAVKGAEAAGNDAKTRTANMAWLALTLGAGNPPGGIPATPDGKPAEKPEGWRDDQATARKAFATPASDKIDIEQLRLDIAAWLDNEAAGMSSPARKGQPRAVRLAGAQQAVSALAPATAPKPNPVARTSAWAAWQARVREAMDSADLASAAALRDLQASRRAARTAQEALDNAQRQARADRLRANGRRASADYSAALATLGEVKARVLSALRSSGATPNVATVLARLRTEVQAARDKALAAAAPAVPTAPSAPAGAAGTVTVVIKAAAAPNDTADRYATADAVLQELVVSPRLVSGGTPQRDVDVLDGVIAQLRYRHLEMLRGKGKDDPETQRAQASLEAAQKQRNDMAFLRPASSYLRSVYAATATQNDPGLQWQNMLFENTLPIRLARQLQERGLKNPFAPSAWELARAELDKAYWQNINSVKVGAAGSSNFVVAKDDVGNWYVKAMGSDPGAMVKAAKNLALYNAGAGLNTNLLRVNELRGRIDNEDNADKRNEMRSELDGLTGSAGGPTVAERSRTLTLFRRNYDDQTQVQLDGLKTRLGNQVFRLAIEPRWRATLADASTEAREALLKVFDQPDIRKPYDAAVTALATTTADAASAGRTRPGLQIVEALRQLQAWRGALKAAVARADGLTLGEQTQATEAARRLDARQRELDNTVAARTKAATTLADAEKARQAVDGGGPSDAQADRVNTAWETARQAYAEAVRLTAAAEAQVADERGKLDAAQKLVAAAKARQAAAAADVDAVLDAPIKDLVAQRLQVVRDTETAVKIVGNSAP